MKYNNNDRYRFLCHYKEQVEKTEVDNIGFERFEAVYNDACEKLIGLTTSSGYKVEMVSWHLTERIIGSKNRKKGLRAPVPVSFVKKVITEGKVVASKTTDKGKTETFKIDKIATVSFNLDTKKIIQCTPLTGELK